jgi:hypothetical protein
MSAPAASHQVEIAANAAQALAAARAVATEWAASWETDEPDGRTDGGTAGAAPTAAEHRLTLPMVAGLRRGEVQGRLRVEPAQAGGVPNGVRLRFLPGAETLRIQPIPTAFLAFAGFGCLVVLAWPFVPALTPLVPFSVLLALGAWFLVIAKLSNSGPAEFLDAVRERAESADG